EVQGLPKLIMKGDGSARVAGIDHVVFSIELKVGYGLSFKDMEVQGLPKLIMKGDGSARVARIDHVVFSIELKVGYGLRRSENVARIID
nr:hypothetical protein [Tanacetum cinerariifolium]